MHEPNGSPSTASGPAGENSRVTCCETDCGIGEVESETSIVTVDDPDDVGVPMTPDTQNRPTTARARWAAIRRRPTIRTDRFHPQQRYTPSRIDPACPPATRYTRTASAAGGPMSRVSASVATSGVGAAASVTSTVKLKTPDVVGVP